MKLSVSIRSFSILALLLLNFTVILIAQSDSGSAAIEGIVKDQNGAVVQGATIVVRNKDTNLERTLTTSANGSFASSVLPVGAYAIAVKAVGFADATVQTNLKIGETTPAVSAIRTTRPTICSAVSTATCFHRRCRPADSPYS